MNYWGKRFTSAVVRADGNGTKQFGGAAWYNGQRIGLQLNFYRWELQFMWEKR